MLKQRWDTIGIRAVLLFMPAPIIIVAAASRHVTLPLVRLGIITVLLFSFILSFDEVTVKMFLVGPFITILPVETYSFIQESGTPVVAAISTVLVVMTLLLVILLERLVGLELFCLTGSQIGRATIAVGSSALDHCGARTS